MDYYTLTEADCHLVVNTAAILTEHFAVVLRNSKDPARHLARSIIGLAGQIGFGKMLQQQGLDVQSDLDELGVLYDKDGQTDPCDFHVFNKRVEVKTLTAASHRYLATAGKLFDSNPADFYVAVGYHHEHAGDQSYTDNLAQAIGDYAEWSAIAPAVTQEQFISYIANWLYDRHPHIGEVRWCSRRHPQWADLPGCVATEGAGKGVLLSLCNCGLESFLLRAKISG